MIKPENYGRPERLVVHNKLVFRPEDYEVVGVLHTTKTARRSSLFEKFRYKEVPIDVAVYMPKQPGLGNWSTGFELNLAKINEEGLTLSASDCVGLFRRGKHGFDVSGSFPGFITLLNPDQTGMKDEYTKKGYGPRITALEEAIRANLGILDSSTPNQKDFVNVAEKIAPLLASFYKLTPDIKV